MLRRLDSYTYNEICEEPLIGHLTPFNCINDTIGGLYKGQITTLTAGTGVGKTTLGREIAVDYAKQGIKVGLLFLEETDKKTAQSVAALHYNIPLFKLQEQPDLLTREQYEEAFNLPNLIIYAHHGDISSPKVFEKIDEMVEEGCDFIFFDHISVAISGSIFKHGDTKELDRLGFKMLKTVQGESGPGIVVVSHLKKVDSWGKSHEAGGLIEMDHLRGSGALKQVSDCIIALQRNLTTDDDISFYTLVRCLKSRSRGHYSGKSLGITKFNPDTGRLEEVDMTPAEYFEKLNNNPKKSKGNPSKFKGMRY